MTDIGKPVRLLLAAAIAAGCAGSLPAQGLSLGKRPLKPEPKPMAAKEALATVVGPRGQVIPVKNTASVIRGAATRPPMFTQRPKSGATAKVGDGSSNQPKMPSKPKTKPTPITKQD